MPDACLPLTRSVHRVSTDVHTMSRQSISPVLSPGAIRSILHVLASGRGICCMRNHPGTVRTRAIVSDRDQTGASNVESVAIHFFVAASPGFSRRSS